MMPMPKLCHMAPGAFTLCLLLAFPALCQLLNKVFLSHLPPFLSSFYLWL